MSVKVFITIDTEEDLWGEYRSKDNPVANIAKIPLLQTLFDCYGAIPTYLINYPVAMDASANKIFRDLLGGGRCEIGTHCHPWNTPPFRETISKQNSMMCNLPGNLIFRKMETLHRAITDRLGVDPICFRAGRWGFNASVARTIQQLGYLVDTSISPFVDWSMESGRNFIDAKISSYRFDPTDVLREKANGCLLEVPPTVGFFQKNFKLCNKIRKFLKHGTLSRYHLLGLFDRLRLLNFRWLSPELSDGKDMIRLSKAFVRNGHRFLNMSFHSTSLLPGKTPFVSNNLQLEKFLKDIETFLKFAADEGMTFVPLSAALEEK